jgi:hypothetical protein
MCVGYVSSALLARVWRIFGLAVVCIRGVCVFEFDVSGACLARVCGVSGAYLLRVSCVWFVSGACLARVWRVSGAGLDARVLFVCLALVWRVSGARRLRRGRVERVWLQIWFNGGWFSRRVPVRVFFFICLLRVWHAPRAGLARVCCVCLVWSGVCLVRVWRMFGYCLGFVWCVPVCCVPGARLVHVWRVSGLRRLREGRGKRTWCVALVTVVCRVRFRCASGSCLAFLLFSVGLFSRRVRLSVLCV